MVDVNQNTFVILIQYIFGDWWVWLRFTVTAILFRKIVGDAIMKGGSTFWSFMTSLVNRNNKEK